MSPLHSLETATLRGQIQCFIKIPPEAVEELIEEVYSECSSLLIYAMNLKVIELQVVTLQRLTRSLET